MILLVIPLYITCVHSVFLLRYRKNVLLWDTQIYRIMFTIKMNLLAVVCANIKAQTMFYTFEAGCSRAVLTKHRLLGRFVDQLAARRQRFKI